MLVFYARTSTEDQDYGLEGQIDELNRHAEYEKQKFKLFSEQVSSVSTDRPQLEAALEWCREGDILVVTKLDRLARSLRSLFKIQDRLAEKKVGLRILGANGMDTTSPNGKLFINFMGALAEWERDMMLQRQRIGIDKARAEGKYKGTKPTAMVKAGEIKARRAAGEGASHIARELGIGRASVYRALGETPERIQALQARSASWKSEKKANGRAEA